MNYYYNLEKIILEGNYLEKISKFKSFYKSFLGENIDFEKSYVPYKMVKPSYEGYLNIVPAQKILQRKYVNTKEGKINLLHTIAHIEYSAIDLALDAAIRFQNMPMDYYKDWLEVTNDEIRHFEMIEKLLKELGSFYGHMQVHANLFEAMEKTPDLLSRMAIVPRYLEANGLEQNPKIMEKLKSNPDSFNQKVLTTLSIILEEEIEHVRKGDRWFKYECKRLNLNPKSSYINILEKFYPGSTKKKHDLNFEARKKAGFSCDELRFLSKMDL